MHFSFYLEYELRACWKEQCKGLLMESFHDLRYPGFISGIEGSSERSWGLTRNQVVSQDLLLTWRGGAST